MWIITDTLTVNDQLCKSVLVDRAKVICPALPIRIIKEEQLYMILLDIQIVITVFKDCCDQLFIQ